MADINFRIREIGGEEVEAQLDAIAKAASRADSELDGLGSSASSAASGLGSVSGEASDTADNLNKIGKSGEAGAKGVKETEKAAGTAAKSLEKLEKWTGLASKALAGFGILGAIGAVKSLYDMGKALFDMTEMGKDSIRVEESRKSAVDATASALAKISDITRIATKDIAAYALAEQLASIASDKFKETLDKRVDLEYQMNSLRERRAQLEATVQKAARAADARTYQDSLAEIKEIDQEIADLTEEVDKNTKELEKNAAAQSNAAAAVRKTKKEIEELGTPLTLLNEAFAKATGMVQKDAKNVAQQAEKTKAKAEARARELLDIQRDYEDRSNALIEDSNERELAELETKHQREWERLRDALDRGIITEQQYNESLLLQDREAARVRQRQADEAFQKSFISLQSFLEKRNSLEADSQSRLADIRKAADLDELRSKSANADPFTAFSAIEDLAKAEREAAQEAAAREIELTRDKVGAQEEIELRLAQRLREINEEEIEAKKEAYDNLVTYISDSFAQISDVAVGGAEAGFEIINQGLEKEKETADQALVTAEAATKKAEAQGKTSKAYKDALKAEEKAEENALKAARALEKEQRRQAKILAGFKSAQNFAQAAEEVAKAVGSYPDVAGIVAHSLAAAQHVAAGIKWAATAAGNGGASVSPARSAGSSTAQDAERRGADLERQREERDRRRREAASLVGGGIQVNYVELELRGDAGQIFRRVSDTPSEENARGRSVINP